MPFDWLRYRGGLTAPVIVLKNILRSVFTTHTIMYTQIGRNVANRHDLRENSRREFFTHSTALAVGGLSLMAGILSAPGARAQTSGHPEVQRIIIDTDPDVAD